jgi:hypothetical protein
MADLILAVYYAASEPSINFPMYFCESVMIMAMVARVEGSGWGQKFEGEAKGVCALHVNLASHGVVEPGLFFDPEPTDPPYTDRPFTPHSRPSWPKRTRQFSALRHVPLSTCCSSRMRVGRPLS